jgi:outer membrane lipoprotein-sorting protein
MNAGKRRPPPWLPMLIVAAGLSAAPYNTFADPLTPATPWDLAQLMARMHGVRTASARFVEQRFVHLLDRPLQSTGTLIFNAPDRLQKQTVTPTPSRLTVDGDHLTVVQPDGKTNDLSLSQFPEIGALVESIRATLAGDGATLTRYYTATLSGTADDWRLLLEPRDNRLRNFVTTIRIQGDGTLIRSIETVERDGDRTEMTITPDPR